MILWASVHDMLEEQYLDLKNNHFVYLDDNLIFDLKKFDKEMFNKISNTPDKKADIILLVNNFLNFLIAKKFNVVIQPAGNIIFQIYLANACIKNNIVLYYAISDRVSEERVKEDGSVEKISYFKHKGFIKIDKLDFDMLNKLRSN